VTLKILHTSDWHLGKKLYKIDRIPEQKLFLDWLLKQILINQVDYLIIAGDLFDVPSPPAQAVTLFYDFLEEVSSSTNCEVIAIAGNHDSGRFIEAPKNILRSKKIHLKGHLSYEINEHIHALKSKDGKTSVKLTTLPYFRTHEILQWALQHKIKADPAKSQDEIGDTILKALKHFFTLASTAQMKQLPSGHILLAHHMFGAGLPAGSEQALSLSGIESIPINLLENLFDYAALGHIHKPQVVKKENPYAFYPGSPIPMRFSEQTTKKLSLLEFSPTMNIKTIEVPVFRKLISLKTSLEKLNHEIEQILALPQLEINHLRALLEVQIKLSDPEPGLVDKIRTKIKDHPIELLSMGTDFSGQDIQKEHIKAETPSLIHQIPDPLELFTSFYEKKYPESNELPSEVKTEFLELMQQVQHEISEVVQ